MPDGLEDPGLAILCQSRERNYSEISIITFEPYSYAESIGHPGLATTRCVGCYSQFEPDSLVMLRGLVVCLLSAMSLSPPQARAYTVDLGS